MSEWRLFGTASILILFAIMAIRAVVSGETSSASYKDTTFKFKSFIGLDRGGWGMAWSPDSRYVATNDFFSGTTMIFDVETGKAIAQSPPIGPNKSLAWSDDGKLLARTSAFRVFILSADSSNLSISRELTRDAAGCLSFKSERSVEFTADSKFLWVTCNWLGDRASGITPLAAIKLSLADMSVVDRAYLPTPTYGDRIRTESHLRKYGRNVYLIAQMNVSVDYFEAGTKKAKNNPHFTVVELDSHEVMLRDLDLYAVVPGIEPVFIGAPQEEQEYDPLGKRLLLIVYASRRKLISVQADTNVVRPLFGTDDEGSCYLRAFAPLGGGFVVATDGAGVASCATYHLDHAGKSKSEILKDDGVNDIRISPDRKLLLLRANRGFKIYSIN